MSVTQYRAPPLFYIQYKSCDTVHQMSITKFRAPPPFLHLVQILWHSSAPFLHLVQILWHSTPDVSHSVQSSTPFLHSVQILWHSTPDVNHWVQSSAPFFTFSTNPVTQYTRCQSLSTELRPLFYIQYKSCDTVHQMSITKFRAPPPFLHLVQILWHSTPDVSHSVQSSTPFLHSVQILWHSTPDVNH